MSEYETELEPTADEGEAFEDVDIDDLEDFGPDFEPAPEPAAEPAWSPSQEKFEAARAYTFSRLEQAAQELGVVPSPHDVNPATGYTFEQGANRAELEIEEWLSQHDPREHEALRDRADALANEAAAKYGPSTEIAHWAMKTASQERASYTAGITEAVSMLWKAAEMRGIIVPEKVAEEQGVSVDEVVRDAERRGVPVLDLPRAVDDMEKIHPDLLARHPDSGNSVYGLAAMAAIQLQDPSDREMQLSEFWGPAATLTEHLKHKPREQPTHDYRKGGTATARAFGLIPDNSKETKR